MLRLIRLDREDDCELRPCRMRRSSQAGECRELRGEISVAKRSTES